MPAKKPAKRTSAPPPDEPEDEEFGEQEDITETPEDFAEEPLPPLINKKTLIGKVVTVLKWKKKLNEDGKPYYIITAKSGKEEVHFSSGSVMYDQIDRRLEAGKSGPFTARVSLTESEVKGHNPFYSFKAPEEE